MLAHPDESLRAVVYRMAEKGFTRMPVVDRVGKFLGLVSLDDLLKARGRHLEEERRRDRPLKLRFLLPGKKSVSKEKTIARQAD
jgi:CBS domain-containing protein